MTAPRWSLLLAVSLAGATAGTATGQDAPVPRLHTNEEYLQDLAQTTTLAIADPIAVFSFVLNSLPDRVKVYPTGNYFYFKFLHDGTPYAGNLRLDALYRERGQLPFAYFPELASWTDADREGDLRQKGAEVILDAAHGVTVEQVDRLVYRVAYRGRSVVFTLNDLSNLEIPARALGPNERYVGPIFDESGVRFFLVYNEDLKIFHYVLDETVAVADGFYASRLTDRITIGRRTGFAFYRDPGLDRRILIGVAEENRRANNYFDGPFDQLPDNFIEGETLRKLILELRPDLEGRIDRLGRSLDYGWRYTISPYLHYRAEDDLYLVHMCVAGQGFQAPRYYRCFSAEPSEPSSRASPGAR